MRAPNVERPKLLEISILLATPAHSKNNKKLANVEFYAWYRRNVIKYKITIAAAWLPWSHTIKYRFTEFP